MREGQHIVILRMSFNLSQSGRLVFSLPACAELALVELASLGGAAILSHLRSPMHIWTCQREVYLLGASFLISGSHAGGTEDARLNSKLRLLSGAADRNWLQQSKALKQQDQALRLTGCSSAPPAAVFRKRQRLTVGSVWFPSASYSCLCILGISPVF